MSSWDLAAGKHGATTKNAKKYIDFAAEHGFDEVLIEGWNYGWTPYWGSNFAPEMDFTRPAEAFDWEDVIAYAKSKNVYIQAYNETAANTENYLSQIDSAYAMYERMGYRSVKVGQVNDKFKNGEWHHGQYGVNYYRTVAKKGAEHKLAINFHEPIKPTGMRRTYPNIVSREGARGQEFNAWDKYGGNPPEHTCILPFTRLLAGPMDFTPGIFSVRIPQRENNQVNTTLAKQLALYVILYSPIQMAADLIENYETRLDALQFITDVPVDWETTKVIDAAIADYVIIARKDKFSADWYLGAITDEHQRSFRVRLDFLEDDFKYEAQIYRDAEGSDYKSDPENYTIITQEVDSADTLTIDLPRGGGTAIRFKMINKLN
jgi:alpha-glucosidase